MPIDFAGTQFPLLVREGWNYVVDNIRGAVSAVVGWVGIKLNDGWFHSLVAGTRPGRTAD